jgi:nitrite reductase/ring-hydroxylating ferredoxin subunit
VSAGVQLERLAAGRVEDYAAGEVRLWPTRTGSIGVVRTAQGFYALRNRCPHQAGPICAGKVTGTMLPSRPHEDRYDASTPVIRCPLHRWEFRLTDGRSTSAITRKRLVTYGVEIEDGAVYVLLRPGVSE